MIIQKNAVSTTYERLYSYQNQKIGIPIFQRFYSWKEKEIYQFKEDMLSAIDDKNKDFYFLDFIYYMEDGKIKLADGQQRIVTLNNFIKAIQKVSEEEKINIDIKLFDIEYDNFSNQDKYIKHFTKYETAPFKKVYLDLLNFVRTNKTRINDFIYVIKNSIHVYMKKCNNADDAFDIFQQINTGGKPLSKDEVIKTAIDQYSSAFSVPFSTANMKDVKASLISFYKLKTPSFSGNFGNMEIMTFLRNEVTKDKPTFQNFVSSMTLLSSLSGSAIYQVINYINRITLLDVPNVLSLIGVDINTDRNWLENVVIPLCLMSVVLTMNGGSPTSFRYLLNDVISKIKSGENYNQINEYLIAEINSNKSIWQISMSDFTNKLGDISVPRGIKKALLILDVICRNVSGTINVSSINLEHIYPQRPDIEWARNGWPSSQSLRAPLIDNIGNYLLLCSSVNKSVSNKYITHKIPQYNAIISSDRILQTPINTVDFHLFETQKETYIKNRQTEIAKKLQAGLPLGPVIIK